MVINKEKDIILICKGWYNKEKYHSIIEALKAYQCEYCGNTLQDIPYEDVLRFALYPVAEKYFKQQDWMYLFREMIAKDISFNRFEQICINKATKDISLSYEYLCNVFIRQITLLQVLKDDGKVIIDFSEYPKNHVII